MRSKLLALAFLLGAGPLAGTGAYFGWSGAWASACASGVVSLFLAWALRPAPWDSAAAIVPGLVTAVLAGVSAFVLVWCVPVILVPAWPALDVVSRSPLLSASVAAGTSLLSAFDLARDRAAGLPPPTTSGGA